MDPSGFIGLVSNLLLFVESSSKIIKASRDIWMQKDIVDCIMETRELDNTMVSLQEIFRKLEIDKSGLADHIQSGLIQDCSKLISDLQELLARLTRKLNKGKVDRLKIFTFALNYHVKIKEINNLEIRINRIRDTIFCRLNFHLHTRLNDFVMPASRNGVSEIPESSVLSNSLLTMRRQIETIVEHLDKHVGSLEELQRFSPGSAMTSISPTLRPLSNTLPDMDKEMMKLSKIQPIASSLHFRQIRDRESEVAVAHANTFEWIFRNETDVSFKDWLQSEAGVFWVTGKAGSGKSTLMKFLVRSSETRALLRKWAQNHKLLVAKHFFWSAGSSMQKSQLGLLRTLLFDLIVEYPDITPVIFPQRWNDNSSQYLDDWTLAELLQCLGNLSLVREPPVYVCLFIDGLDEYNGDHTELASALLKLSRSPHIKICASSRPWVDFLDAFGASPWKLSIHELTAPDIDTFVSDMLLGNEKFQRLQESDDAAGTQLVTEIRTKAQGVFLWVYLVVRSLLRGLRNEDSIRDLNSRLRQFPVELEDFFQRMLDGIDTVYWQRTARLLQLVKNASEPIPFLTLFYVNLNSAEEPNECLISLRDWPEIDPKWTKVLNVKKRQITAQCKDLLYITTDPSVPALLAEKITPIHRTVIDFLNAKDVDELLRRRAGSEFEVWKTLLNATACQVKALISVSRLIHIRERLPAWFSDIIIYARHMEIETGHAGLEIFNSLEQALLEYCRERKWSLTYLLGNTLGQKSCFSFLDLAIKHGLSLYAAERVRSRSEVKEALLLERDRGGLSFNGRGPLTSEDRIGQYSNDVVGNPQAMGVHYSPEKGESRTRLYAHKVGVFTAVESTTTQSFSRSTLEVQGTNKSWKSLWGILH